MNDTTFYTILFLTLIVISLFLTIILLKNNCTKQIVNKFLGTKYFNDKDEEYFKSKKTYKYLKITTNLSVYIFLFVLFFLLGVSIYFLNLEYSLITIGWLLISPILYRIEIFYRLSIHKKR